VKYLPHHQCIVLKVNKQQSNNFRDEGVQIDIRAAMRQRSRPAAETAKVVILVVCHFEVLDLLSATLPSKLPLLRVTIVEGAREDLLLLA
jgi:hypothetical protein